MRQRCIELMDAALLCAISDKYAREARAEEEAQKCVGGRCMLLSVTTPG